MNNEIERLKKELDAAKKEISKQERIIKESSWYKGEYEKIVYSFSYRLLAKMKRILKKIKVYSILEKGVNGARKMKNNFTLDVNKLPAFKYYRFKEARNKCYPFDSNVVEHDYVKGLVSVVVPVYNGADYLGETLQSIIDQTYKNIEIIVVNDGSTDNTLSVAKKYAKKDSRIKVIDQENTKLPGAINNGFKVAKGEYYMWFGADDLFHADSIEVLIEEFNNDKNADFFFANIRLIDENGKPIKDNKWYNTDKEHPEYVMLPNDMSIYNIERNNYIGPGAIYKSIVVKMLGDFSAKRFTVEDYEYCMRINNIFNLKHTLTEKPLFDYRRHSSSLTSQAKELNIIKKAEELMLFEDFRRDYLLTPLFWTIDVEDEQNPLYLELLKLIEESGHIIVNDKELCRKTYSSIYKNQVYVCIGYDAKKQEEKLKRISPDTFKVLISDKTKNVSDKFDLYLSNKSIKLFDVDKYKGWFKITDAQNLFSFIDIKVKHKYLEMMDYYIGAEKEYEKKLSIVICTYKRSEKLNNVLTTSINQTLSKENYEIIVINNDIHDTGVYEVVSQFRKEYNLSDEFLKFCEAPVKGLSFARNVGLFEAKGKRILYLDDDSVAFEDLAEQIIKAYEDNEDAGVVGGQIILKLPKKIPSAFMKGKEAYWSQFLIADSDYKIVNEWYEFPYGANFSVDTKTLLKIGGFRTGYGRVGHNFAGGEEVVVSLLAKRIGKEVVLAPNAKVYHDVDESRYTFEHVEKTDIGGAYTRLRMELDLYKSPYYLIKKRVKEEINYLKQQLNEAKTEKERRYLISNIKGHEIGLKEIDKINREIIKSFKNMSLKKK